MALLTPHPFDANFDQVKQLAEVGGDWYQADAMVRLWAQNLHPIEVRIITAVEQKQCNHSHHGIENRTFDVAPGSLLILPALDVTYMADSSRLIQFTYDGVGSGPLDGLYVAAMRSAES